MNPKQFRLIEHIAFNSALSLEEFCAMASSEFRIPTFALDYENETEWGVSTKRGVEYNVSRPYAVGTLREWDPSVPIGSTFGLSLGFQERFAFMNLSSPTLIKRVGQTLAAALGTTVVHHRTWRAGGENLYRSTVFHPS